jgi:hypothetical protein
MPAFTPPTSKDLLDFSWNLSISPGTLKPEKRKGEVEQWIKDDGASKMEGQGWYGNRTRDLLHPKQESYH